MSRNEIASSDLNDLARLPLVLEACTFRIRILLAHGRRSDTVLGAIRIGRQDDHILQIVGEALRRCLALAVSSALIAGNACAEFAAIRW